MPVVRLIEDDGAEHFIEVENGQSLMDAAVKTGIFSLIAECRGSLACGICRVQIAEYWCWKMGEMSDLEAGIIDTGRGCAPGERLSCQIVMNDALDGLTARVAAPQF